MPMRHTDYVESWIQILGRGITNRNNAPISNYGGSFRCKSEYPWCIIELNFQKHFYEICRKRDKLQVILNISRRYLKILLIGTTEIFNFSDN
ncbi:Uncharacterized protein FWK35_00021886, partial [Aphis craccivora]